MRPIKSLSRVTISLVAGLALGTALSTAYAAEDGWTTLIDGTEGMDNFTIVGDANWSAEHNAIQANAGSGSSWLVTKNNYGDFSLRVEFWASDDANSGIYMRCEDANRITDRTCYEANIYDQRPDPSFGTGAIVHIAAVDEPRPMAGNSWNVFVITLQGDHLIVELNNERTVDVRDDSLASGPIGLQWARGTLRFRKVEIKEL